MLKNIYTKKQAELDQKLFQKLCYEQNLLFSKEALKMAKQTLPQIDRRFWTSGTIRSLNRFLKFFKLNNNEELRELLTPIRQKKVSYSKQELLAMPARQQLDVVFELYPYPDDVLEWLDIIEKNDTLEKEYLFEKLMNYPINWQAISALRLKCRELYPENILAQLGLSEYKDILTVEFDKPGKYYIGDAGHLWQPNELLNFYKNKNEFYFKDGSYFFRKSYNNYINEWGDMPSRRSEFFSDQFGNNYMSYANLFGVYYEDYVNDLYYGTHEELASKLFSFWKFIELKENEKLKCQFVIASNIPQYIKHVTGTAIYLQLCLNGEEVNINLRHSAEEYCTKNCSIIKDTGEEETFCSKFRSTKQWFWNDYSDEDEWY